MVKCPECGQTLPDDAKFCTECGHDLSTAEIEENSDMIITTTNSVEGRKIREYLGVVSGEAMMGANIVKDFTAGIRNIVGGRSGQYEDEIREGRMEAVKDMKARAKEKGADAIIGVTADYEEMSEGMLWINTTGTAVKFES